MNKHKLVRPPLSHKIIHIFTKKNSTIFFLLENIFSYCIKYLSRMSGGNFGCVGSKTKFPFAKTHTNNHARFSACAVEAFLESIEVAAHTTVAKFLENFSPDFHFITQTYILRHQSSTCCNVLSNNLVIFVVENKSFVLQVPFCCCFWKQWKLQHEIKQTSNLFSMRSFQIKINY